MTIPPDYFALQPVYCRLTRHWQFSIEATEPETLNCIEDYFAGIDLVDALWRYDDERALIVQLSAEVARDAEAALFAVGTLMTALECLFAPPSDVWGAAIETLDFEAEQQEGYP